MDFLFPLYISHLIRIDSIFGFNLAKEIRIIKISSPLVISCAYCISYFCDFILLIKTCGIC